MPLYEELETRCESKCELCSSANELNAFTVEPKSGDLVSEQIAVCATCNDQLENNDNIDANHWRCLNDSMWSEHKPILIVAWRMLSRLRKEGWPQDLLDMMYLEDETLEYAKATGEGEPDPEKLIHRDVNGVILEAGDSVVLIKDLKVKGSSLIAKQGTAVRRISLDQNNAEFIEGKVGPTQIVIITKYVKKL